MDLEKLIVPLLLDPAKYLDGIQKASQQADSLQGKLANFGGSLVVGGLGMAAAGVTTLTGFLVTCGLAASDSEDVMADINATLKSTKGVAGMTAESLNELATALGNTTKFEDDTILKGEGMLLTFTNIGKNVFPMATESMLNMAQKMGGDLQGSAIQLGKALNDPTKGITALTRVGVTFTDKQKKMIETLQKSGDLEGAQTIILKELETEFGGVAKAAGQTASGKLTILKNKLGNLQETIGGAVLPAFEKLGDKLITVLDNPAITEGIATISTLIGELADSFIVGTEEGGLFGGVLNALGMAGEYAPIFNTIAVGVEFLGNTFKWVFDNILTNAPVMVGIFGALTVAMAVWAFTTVSAALPAIGLFLAASWPMIAVLGAVGLACGLLYAAWQNNWGGIREKTAAFWAWLQPILQNLWNWLQVSIPIALAWLADKWQNVLLPSITSIWSWIQSNLFPLFTDLFNWLNVSLPVAIKFLTDAWNLTLLPILTKVWDWVKQNLFPLFQSLSNFIGAEFNLAVTNLSKLWSDTLLPALQGIGGYINETLLPAFKTFCDWIEKNVGPIFDRVGKIITDTFGKALKGIEDSIRWIKGQLDALAGSANSANSGNGGKPPDMRANGGPVNKGQVYIVGEKRPELFVPQSNGKIIPEIPKSGGKGDTYITVNPHYYKGDEPTLLSELSMIKAFTGG